MTCITKQHVGKYTYLYESTSFRDELGRSRNKKVKIGKLDLKTGQPIYTKEYLSRMSEAGTPVEVHNPEQTSESIPEKDLISSFMETVTLYGGYYLLREIAKKIGLLDILKDSLPRQWGKVLNLAFFLVAAEAPSRYFKYWLNTATGRGPASLAPHQISEPFADISEDERNRFYSLWFSHMHETDCAALDITSVSSYSNLMDSADFGYDSDHEMSKQINICLLMGKNTQMPVYQSSYTGSLKDAAALLSALDEAYAVCPQSDLKIASDGESFSAKNIKSLRCGVPRHSSETEYDAKSKWKCGFLTAVPFSDGFARSLIDRNRAHIDEPKNVIDMPEGVIYGVHRVCQWPGTGARLNVFIYSNLQKVRKDTDEMNAMISSLKTEAEKDPFNEKYKPLFDKYLSIRKSPTEAAEYSVNVRKDVISEELYADGWLILISNYIDNTKEAISTYRTKDFVKNIFDQIKNRLELPRMRVHDNVFVQNKLFVSFIVLILTCYIDKVMRDSNLYKKYTMKELINKMSQLRRGSFNGKKIMQAPDKQQKEIIKTFAIPSP